VPYIPQLKVPQYVSADLGRFIFANYGENLPNSLLVAQAFILANPDYGRNHGLTVINNAVEDGIKEGRF
jgi:hypothetical protein